MKKKLLKEFTINIERLSVEQVIYILKTIQKERKNLDRNLYNPSQPLEEIVKLCAPFTKDWRLCIENHEWWFNTSITHSEYTFKDFLPNNIQRKLK